jgi:hypothetical protein
MSTKTTIASGDATLPARRRRRWPWLVGVAVLVLLAALAWLAMGLVGAARDARAAASSARANLEGSAHALASGDQAGARRGIREANLDLAQADAAARRGAVRVAAWLPVVSSPVADLRHLLAAGHIMAATADQAMTVQARFAGSSGVFHDGRIDLAGMAVALDGTTTVLGQLERARAELHQVRGSGSPPARRPRATPAFASSTMSSASSGRSTRWSGCCHRRSAPRGRAPTWWPSRTPLS